MLCLCWMLLCYVYAVGCYVVFMLDVAMLCLCCVPVLPLSSASLTSVPADTKYWSTQSCPSLRD